MVYRLLRMLSGKGFHRYVLDIRGSPPTNFDELMDDLNTYRSSGFEYELLEAVIKRNGCSTSLRKDMDRYAQDIQEFKRHTTISNAITHVLKKRKKRSRLKGHKKLATAHTFDPNKYTLETIDDFGRKVRTNSKCHLNLYHMEVGSVVVEWRALEEEEYALLVFFCGEVGKALQEEYMVSDISLDGVRINHSVCTIIIAYRKTYAFIAVH